MFKTIKTWGDFVRCVCVCVCVCVFRKLCVQLAPKKPEAPGAFPGPTTGAMGGATSWWGERVQ